MTDLVNIRKAGEPDLKISADALAQHVKLGWAEFVPEPVKPEPKADPKK